MNTTIFAAESQSSGLSALGISPSAFVVQLISFVFVFLLLKRFAFKPIIRLLEERRRVIDDGVKLGRKLEKERDQLDKEVAQVMRDARADADKVIAGAHKEAREIIREAEKAAKRKTDAMMADAEVKMKEEATHARRSLEKEIVGLVSDATEAIVDEKVDSKKDKEIIKKAIKGQSK